MIPTVRSSRDWPKILPALLFCALIPCGAQVTSGQQQTETPQQTNAKIQELASLVRNAPRDTAVGTGDLLHVDVFDVPELSRDVRVGEAGEIGYPLIPGRIQINGL